MLRKSILYSNIRKNPLLSVLIIYLIPSLYVVFKIKTSEQALQEMNHRIASLTKEYKTIVINIKNRDGFI